MGINGRNSARAVCSDSSWLLGVTFHPPDMGQDSFGMRIFCPTFRQFKSMLSSHAYTERKGKSE
jgi:hypothetical protein